MSPAAARSLLAALALLAPAGPARADTVSCYLRGGVAKDVSGCSRGGAWRTFVLTGSRTAATWTGHDAVNCFDRHGSSWGTGDLTLMTNRTYTLAACEVACKSNPKCNAVTVGPATVAPPPPCPGGILFNPGEQILGPGPDNVTSWRAKMDDWKACVKKEMNYTGAVFDVPELRWTQTSYIQPQMHPYDRLFFDPIADNYTVQRWLDDVNARYGGVDSILMWPTYTNIGTDDRSQFDLFEAMPGGVEGVRRVVDELHAAGVKVLIPYNPWDAGTLRCGPEMATCGGNANLTAETARDKNYCNGSATASAPGKCDARIMDSLIAGMNADGFNGDTMGVVPRRFFDVSMELKHPIAIEPEGGGQATGTLPDSEGGGHPGEWDSMGWGYWKYPYVPSVDSWKWLDSRRMTNICERWSKNHTNALQFALFNGDGFESWENVWGTWNGITERDGEQIRRVGALLRFLGGRGYLQSQAWVPHTSTTDTANLFASHWPSDDGTAAWTVVNRLLTPMAGHGLANVTAPAGYMFFDLYNGVEVHPTAAGVLPLNIERFGAILLTKRGPDKDPELNALLGKMADYAKVPLASLSATWTWEQGKRVPSGRAESPNSTDGMTKISGGPLRFSVKGIEIEGGGAVGDPRDQKINVYGVDFQYEWEAEPNRYHTQWLNVPEYWLDTTLVTQAAFADFLAKHNAVSADRYHYLKNMDWSDKDLPKPHAGNGTLPVTYVGMDEARAYCKAMGKRLPREEEWHFASTGGGDSTFTYPWGYSAPNASTTPVQRTGTVFPGPEHVGQYTAGASPFGILDMVGNVWQLTDEYQDAHTRSVILRGGANYRPSSSIWYFPQTDGNCATGHCGMTTNQVHNKYFLMNSRYERAGTIGFRCAADVPGSDTLDCGDKALCGRFQAPAAKVELPDSDREEWIVWGGAGSVRSDDGRRSISEAVSGGADEALVVCNGTQSTFYWQRGSSARGTCLANGTKGILFNVSATPGKSQTLSVYAGATASAAMMTATLLDGGETTVWREHVNSNPVDAMQKLTYNLKWEVQFTAKSRGATLLVNVSAPLHFKTALPPPPPPKPVACTEALCGAVVKNTGDTDLSVVGTSDWTHYGLGALPGGDDKSVNRKCDAGALIRPLKVINGGEASYGNNAATFSWANGGFMPGTVAKEAQVGSVAQTPTAIWSGSLVKGLAPGGFDFAVTIPAVKVPVSVYVYAGTSGNMATLNATLSGAGATDASYVYTTPAVGSAVVATLTVPPAKAAGLKRTLIGTWVQTEANSKTVQRNIQFHAIAVDAGGPIAGGAEVPCSHGVSAVAAGRVVLQAATLA